MKIERKKDGKRLIIEIDWVRLEQVMAYKYLGVNVTDGGRDEQDTTIRLT